MKIVQLIGVVCVAALVACGQKGPLVMPDAQKHKRTIPTLPGAPAKPTGDKPTGDKPTPSPAPTDGSAVSPTPPATDTTSHP